MQYGGIGQVGWAGDERVVGHGCAQGERAAHFGYSLNLVTESKFRFGEFVACGNIFRTGIFGPFDEFSFGHDVPLSIVGSKAQLYSMELLFNKCRVSG